MSTDKLNVGDYGDDVARLHENLKARGLDVSAEEVKRKFFGPATRDAVRECQTCNGLEATGEVNDATATALLTLVAGSPTHPIAATPRLSKESPAPLLSPGGRKAIQPIEPPLRPNDTGKNVANLQDALLQLFEKKVWEPPPPDPRLVAPNPLLLLRRDRETQTYKEGTTLVVRLFRNHYKEQFQLDPGEIVDERTAEALNRLLQEIGAFDTPQGEWLVRGQVVDASGPVNDIQVSVFDRDLFFRRGGANTDQPLGNEITKKLPTKNEDGWFEFAFVTADFAAGDVPPTEGDPTPDLIFALSRDRQPLETFQIYRLPDGKELAEETLVSDDDLILGIQARRLEEVRILIPGGEPKPQMSEYERLWRAIERLLPEQAPEDADAAQRERLVCAAATRFDEEKHRDISFVARETGSDRLLIQRFANACRLAVDPFQNLPTASVFYALARIRGASDLLSLARLSTEDLRLALNEATAGTPPLIPPFDPPGRLEDSVQTIRKVLASHLPNYRSAEGAPSLADLVGAVLPDPEDQATLWRTYSDHSGTPAEFWEKLKTQPGFDDEKIAKTQYSFQLGWLTQNNISLVNAIRSKHPDVSNAGELAFHLDTQEKWTALLNAAAVPIPPDVPGTDETRKVNYAASLAIAMQVAHPTAAVANMVARLPPTQLADAQPAVAKFLAEAVREAKFDLVTGRIDDLVAQHGDKLLKEIDVKNRAVVIGQVKRLQRLFRLSSGPESMKALIDAGFNSARDLAELPPEIAMEMLGPVLGETTARLMLNRASKISAAAVHQYIFLNEAINGDIPRGAI